MDLPTIVVYVDASSHVSVADGLCALISRTRSVAFVCEDEVRCRLAASEAVARNPRTREQPAVDPKTLKKWLIVVAVLYLILPRDLVPDFLGRGLGLIDDALLIGLFMYLYRHYQREYAARATEGSGTSGKQRASSQRRAGESEPPFDPYRVLAIAPSASTDEIRSAYKARMREYHPDKVEHLGVELRELAHHKVLDIQKAYRQLGG